MLIMGKKLVIFGNVLKVSIHYSVEHELTFFKLDEQTNQYHRYDELHFQRTFPITI